VIKSLEKIGGRGRDRTGDPLLANQIPRLIEGHANRGPKGVFYSRQLGRRVGSGRSQAGRSCRHHSGEKTLMGERISLVMGMDALFFSLLGSQYLAPSTGPPDAPLKQWPWP
jgi:hypothetical protein